jgi:hypothetical protein
LSRVDNLRDGKRERVRAAYTDLLVSARLVLQRAKIMRWLTEVAGVNKDITGDVERAFADLDPSLASSPLESDAHEIVRIFESVRQAFVELKGRIVPRTQGRSGGRGQAIHEIAERPR